MNISFQCQDLSSQWEWKSLLTFHRLLLDFSQTLKCPRYAATSLFLQACCRSYYLHNLGFAAHNPNSNDLTRLTGPSRFSGRAFQSIIFGNTVYFQFSVYNLFEIEMQPHNTEEEIKPILISDCQSQRRKRLVNFV